MPSVTFTATTNRELVAAPGAGKFIRVWGYRISGKDSDAVLQLRSDTTPIETILTPASGVGGFGVATGKEPICDCEINKPLNLNTGGTTGVYAINVTYSVVG